MTTVVVVPVKDLDRAKSRMSPLLSADERRALAIILLEGVLEAVTALTHDIRKVVVTNYAPAMKLAEAFGMEVLKESRQKSESASVDHAGRVLEGEGVRAMLRVPLDLPLIEAAELAELIELADNGLPALLVPSLDGTGTNAIYRAPPTLIPSRFGPGSLALHENALRKAGLRYRVEEMASLALDLDDAGDVAELMSRQRDCPATVYLNSLCIESRLSVIAKEGA